MSRQEKEELVELDALCEVLVSTRRHEVDHHVLTELRRTGAFASIAQAAESKWRFLHENGLARPTLADADLSLEELLLWYTVRFRPVGPSLETHLSRLGFASRREFLGEALGQFLLERASVKGTSPDEPEDSQE
jgi:hypothetical protein